MEDHKSPDILISIVPYISFSNPMRGLCFRVSIKRQQFGFESSDSNSITAGTVVNKYWNLLEGDTKAHELVPHFSEVMEYRSLFKVLSRRT